MERSDILISNIYLSVLSMNDKNSWYSEIKEIVLKFLSKYFCVEHKYYEIPDGSFDYCKITEDSDCETKSKKSPVTDSEFSTYSIQFIELTKLTKSTSHL